MRLIRGSGGRLTWWWGFGLLIGAPALALALLGLRTIRTERIEQEQQVREQQRQVARLADAEIATELHKIETDLGRYEKATPETGGEPDAALRDFFAFSLDRQGVLAFDQDKVYFGEPGQSPLAKGSLPQWSFATERLIEQAQAAEAQHRPGEAISAYRQIITVEPKLADWAELGLARVNSQSRADSAHLFAGQGWGRSDGLTPMGLPVALVAFAHVEQLPQDELASFAQVLEKTIKGLRAGRWWLSYEARHFHDAQLRSLLKKAGSIAYQTEDVRLDEMAMIERIIRASPPAARDGVTRSFETEAGRAFIILRLPSSREPSTSVGVAIPPERLKKILDQTIGSLLSNQSFAATIRDGQDKIVWGALPDGSQTSHVESLRSLKGLILVFASPAGIGGVNRKESLWYGFISLLVVMALVGLAMTVQVMRREAEVARMQNDFIAAVSHEFKSPITSIRLLMERIASGRTTTPQAAGEYHAAIARETDRLERHVNRLLEAQQIQDGRKEYTFAPASLVGIAESAIDELRPQAEAKSIRVEAQLQAGIPEVKIDKAALKEAVVNLLDNAIKYSPSESRITVIFRVRNRQLCLDVSDQGIGIERDELPRVFDKFYRGRRGNRHNVRGTGLGLALVKAAVEAHGGTIGVESTPGQGSCFSLRLPLNEGNENIGAHTDS